MATRWIELSIAVPSGAAEGLADAVGALTGGVESRDTETIIRVEGGRSLILAQCAPDAEADVVAELEAACERLRAAGVDVLMHAAGESGWGGMKAQFRRADASGARWALIFGEAELARGEVAVKPLREAIAAQRSLPLAEAERWAAELRAEPLRA